MTARVPGLPADLPDELPDDETARAPIPADALVIGLGGNLGSEEEIVARFRVARRALAGLGRSVASPVYRTAPQGGPPQPPYLNAALAFAVAPGRCTEEALIARVLEIEAAAGRVRDPAAPLAARTLDLDVLVWGARQVVVVGPPALTVPHPRLHLRRFALAPMIDVLGEHAEVPGLGITLIAAWDALRAEGQVVERTRWEL